MCILNLFIISMLLSPLAALSEASGSAFFIDSPTHQYLRTPSSINDVDQSGPLSITEVGAAVSVLLGFTPPRTLSAHGSSKLNKVLMPNPFDRPRAVFMLEVTGVDAHLVASSGSDLFRNAFHSDVNHADVADIELPEKDEVSVVSLDEPLAESKDQDIFEFASWLGGSYVTESSEPLNGVLSLPLRSGAYMNFHMSKKADREFVASLMVLSRNINRAVDLHGELRQSVQRPAELMMGSFTGIKALREQYEDEGVAKQGTEIVLATLSKIFASLETAHKGQIVGVIVFNGEHDSESQKMMNVMYTSQSSLRRLGEIEGSSEITRLVEIALVRFILALIAGFILIIATLLGMYFLFNMPITRDTLLYSNVKLD